MVAKATAPRRENVPRHILFYGGSMKSDTIAAIATALSDAGIGIIRIRPFTGSERKKQFRKRTENTAAIAAAFLSGF